jgi:hypothetical protein
MENISEEVEETMKMLSTRTLIAAIAVALTLSLVGPTSANAQGKAKSTQTEAEWIKFDPEAKTVTVKVKKPGRGKDAKRLKKNKEATFNVKPEGSVLTRTTVSINGMKAELSDLPAGKTVNIYWRPDTSDDTKMFARKIDAILSEADLDAREVKN